MPGLPVYLSVPIDLGVAYTLSSPNLIVQLPDMTNAPTVIPGVSPAISVSANPHTFSYLFIPTQAGRHFARFQFLSSLGSGTINIDNQFFVYWTDLRTKVRGLLGVNSSSLPDSSVDDAFYAVSTSLNGYTNFSLPPYNNFNETYAQCFDLGISYLIAAWLRPSLGGKASTGEISLFKKGTTTVQYTSSQPKQILTIEDTWIQRGMQILSSQIPEIASAWESDRSQDEIMSRGDLAIGNSFRPTGEYEGI